MPTQEQINKIDQIKRDGYIWDKELSASYTAVVLVKGIDRYVFGLDGSISHNPSFIKIKC